MIEGLEAIKDIKECLFWSDKGLQDIATIEKELKALAIIRRNKMIEFDLEWELDNNLITKEEYNLLKEVCNDK